METPPVSRSKVECGEEYDVWVEVTEGMVLLKRAD